MMCNWMAIFAPMAMASGSLKQIQPKFLNVMIQMLFVFSLPLVFAPTILPLGLEGALEALGWVDGLPIHLVLSVLVCAIVVCTYPFALIWQGSVFQAREQKILEIVTTKTE